MSKPKLRNNFEVLAAMRKYYHKHQIMPTVRELCNLLGVGSNRTVLRYLITLEQAGLIRRWAGARGMSFLEGGEKAWIPITTFEDFSQDNSDGDRVWVTKKDGTVDKWSVNFRDVEEFEWIQRHCLAYMLIVPPEPFQPTGSSKLQEMEHE